MQYAIIFMVVASFFIQYTLMSVLMTNKVENITNSLGKFYVSSIMGLSMGVVEVAMHDVYMGMGRVSMKYYVPLCMLLFIFIWLYRNQVYIGDIQYLDEMIEHHSMALFTSKEILRKTSNYKVARLAKNIVQGQTDEIGEMRKLIASLKH